MSTRHPGNNASSRDQATPGRSELERAGTPIGPNDLLLAAHPCALDVTFLTVKAREFGPVKGLRVENWLRS